MIMYLSQSKNYHCISGTSERMKEGFLISGKMEPRMRRLIIRRFRVFTEGYLMRRINFRVAKKFHGGGMRASLFESQTAALKPLHFGAIKNVLLNCIYILAPLIVCKLLLYIFKFFAAKSFQFINNLHWTQKMFLSGFCLSELIPAN